MHNSSGSNSSGSQRDRRPRVRQVGRYKLDHKLLGKGNFARVELATHTILGLQVAVKLIDKSHITEDYVRRNLGREARIMARLRHPHIAALYEAIESGHLVCLVTELAPGGDLCSYVKARAGGKLTEQQASPFLRQIVSALSYMHERGILHRDLKMENVMLDETQTQAKIVDFGLSNFYGPGVSLMTHCGSPEYAAPELFVPGKAYGPQVDVWSLGIIMYGALTGCLPFLSPRHEGCSAHERRQRLYQRIQEGLGQHHWRALGNVSPEARHLLAILLDPDPEQRIPLREVERHPFITGNGRHPLPTNHEISVKDLDGRLVLRRLSAILSVPSSVLEAEIERDDHCEVAAMFYLMLAARNKNKGVVSTLPNENTAWCAMASALNNNETAIEVPTESVAANGPSSTLVKFPFPCKEVGGGGHVVAEVTVAKVCVQGPSIMSNTSNQVVSPVVMEPLEVPPSPAKLEPMYETSEETVTEDNGTIYGSCYDDDNDKSRLIARTTHTPINEPLSELSLEDEAEEEALTFRAKEATPSPPSSDARREPPTVEKPRSPVPTPSPLPPPPPRRFTLRSLCFRAASEVELLAGDGGRGGKSSAALNYKAKDGFSTKERSCKKVSPMSLMDDEQDMDESHYLSRHKFRRAFKPKKNSSCLCMALTDTKLFLRSSWGDCCHLDKQTKSMLKMDVGSWLSSKLPHVCLMELLKLHWRVKKWYHQNDNKENAEEEDDVEYSERECQLLRPLLGWHCHRSLSAPASFIQRGDSLLENGRCIPVHDLAAAKAKLSTKTTAAESARVLGPRSKSSTAATTPVSACGEEKRKKSLQGKRIKVSPPPQPQPSSTGRSKFSPGVEASPRTEESNRSPHAKCKNLSEEAFQQLMEGVGNADGESAGGWRREGAERGDGGAAWLDEARMSSWLRSYEADQRPCLYVRGTAIPSRPSSINRRRRTTTPSVQRRRRFRSLDNRSVDDRCHKND